MLGKELLEIMRLEPGPEFDRQVAERVMGWEEGTDFKITRFGLRKYDINTGLEGDYWEPSTEVLAAHDVINDLIARGFTLDIMSPRPWEKCRKWVVFVWDGDEKIVADVEEKTFSAAVCRAALLTIARGEEGK